MVELQEKEHGRKKQGEGWRLSVTAGSQDAIYKVSFYFCVRVSGRAGLRVGELMIMLWV